MRRERNRDALVRGLKLTALLPKSIRELEPLTPQVKMPFSDGRIARVETPRDGGRHCQEEGEFKGAVLAGKHGDVVAGAELVAEIGEELGMSRERVRQVERDALARLRDELAGVVSVSGDELVNAA